MKKKIMQILAALLVMVMLTASLAGCKGSAAYDYADVLSSYREILSKARGGEIMIAPEDEEDVVANLLYDIGQICLPEKMGYALKDINRDGVDELVLMSEDYRPYALFTAEGGKAVLLWDWVVDGKLSTGAIDRNGYIYGREARDINTEGWCNKVMCIGKDGKLSSFDYGSRVVNADADPMEYEYFVAVGGREYEIGKMDAAQNIPVDKFGDFTWNHDTLTYEAGFYYVGALSGQPSINANAYEVDFSSYDAVLATYRQMIPYMEKGVDRVNIDKFSFTDHEEYETFFSVAQAAHRARPTRFDSERGKSVYLPEGDLAYGYAHHDINGDGTDELMLMLDDYSVFALFTLRNGKPVLLLDTDMTIGADGLIRTGRGEVDRYYSDYYIYEIDENGSLQTKLHFGYLFAESMYGYRIENGAFVPVSTSDELWELYLEHFVRVYPHTRPDIMPTVITEQGKEFTRSVNDISFVQLESEITPQKGMIYHNFRTLNPTDDEKLDSYNKLIIQEVTDGLTVEWDVYDSRDSALVKHVLSGTARADGDSYLLESDGWRLRLEFVVGNVWVVVEQSPVDRLESWSYLFQLDDTTLEPIE